MTNLEIKEAAAAVLSMLDKYQGAESEGELSADRVLFGYLQGTFGGLITRQHRVSFGRIDFRYGTSNPVVIEFAFRERREPRANLYASQNLKELTFTTAGWTTLR